MPFSFQVTNTQANTALTGEDVLVTVAQTELTKFNSINLGDKATLSSSANFGYVSRKDAQGYGFYVKPYQPDRNCASISPGVISVNEIVTILQA